MTILDWLMLGLVAVAIVMGVLCAVEAYRLARERHRLRNDRRSLELSRVRWLDPVVAGESKLHFSSKASVVQFIDSLIGLSDRMHDDDSLVVSVTQRERQRR